MPQENFQKQSTVSVIKIDQPSLEVFLYNTNTLSYGHTLIYNNIRDINRS